MVFSSFTFLCFFLPIVLFGYFLNPTLKAKNMFLLLASLVFYGWADVKYLIYIGFVIFIAYGAARLIDEFKNIYSKRIILILSVCVVFGVLFWFKYFNFAIDIFNSITHSKYNWFNIVLPIGISFYIRRT